ncbi:9963_t:CDS:2, partial [Gigaspora margarita]
MAKVFKQSWEKIVKIREDALLLFGFKTRAKGIPDLNATIKFINAILSNWYGYTIKTSMENTYWIYRVPSNSARFETIERIKAINLNDSNYHSKVPILLPYKPESVNKTQELFDSIPITTDITISESSNKQKFQISQEKQEHWRAKIAFKMRDNNNYWKKEHESMDKVAFLEYKRNFEAKIKVPTTPYKKELKTHSLAFIEYV